MWSSQSKTQPEFTHHTPPFQGHNMQHKIDRNCNCISNYQEAQQGPRDMSAAPFATSVPWMPMATPMSAWFKAGASLTSQRAWRNQDMSKLIQCQTQDALQCSFNKNKQLHLRSWQRLGLAASVTTWTNQKSLIGETPSLSKELFYGLNPTTVRTRVPKVLQPKRKPSKIPKTYFLNRECCPRRGYKCPSPPLTGAGASCAIKTVCCVRCDSVVSNTTGW